jgi:hypothetical protein
VELRERGGDDGALLLAAAERHEGAVLELEGAGRGQSLACDGEVVRPFDLERAEVRVAPHQRDLEHREVEGDVGFLRDDGHAPRELRAWDPPQVRAVHAYDARGGLQRPGEQLEERRLAGAIRPEDGREPARRDVERDAPQDGVRP